MDTDTDRGQKHDADIFVSAEEAARVVSVSARTIRRWINAGDVQAAEGDRGRVVSLSDVRRRAVSGHDRTRPPEEPKRTRTIADTDTSAVMSVMVESVNRMAVFAERLEVLAREAERERIGRLAAESRAETAERERDELRAEVEILRQIRPYRESEPETATMPQEASPAGPGATEVGSMTSDTAQRRRLWRWSRRG